MQDRMNAVLTDKIDKKVELNIDQKIWEINVIDTTQTQTNDIKLTKNIKMCSGSEKFMIELACKIALCHLKKTHCDILIIDEGFGNLDEKHVNDIHVFFSHIKQMYSCIMLITHIEEIKDSVDSILTIRKTPRGSIIGVGEGTSPKVPPKFPQK